MNTYRQIQHVLPYSHNNEVRVYEGRYYLTHREKMKVLKTLLGSCVGLVGYLDGFGFMVHINFYKDTQEILDQLRYDIKKEVGCILEDFHLTLSGGNNTIQSSGKIGIKNIESVLKNINREPDKLLHVGKNKGNRIQLDLISGNVISTH